jgi:hypothetical protein
MNRIFSLLAISLIVPFVLGAASPANAASQDEQTHACRGDAIHFCAAEIPNREKITACMKQHLDKLSPACRAMFKGGKKGGDKGGDNGASQ